MNILMLTSEFAPATGGIGTYAHGVATAATALGARVTVVAPDYGVDSHADDAALPFEVTRFPGGLHSMRDLPSKILLARSSVRHENYDVVHAADWPFFIPLALSRHLIPGRLIVTVHGTEINETQTPLKRLAIRTTGVFGSRTEVAANSRFTRALLRDRFRVEGSRVAAIPLGVSEFWFGPRRRRDVTRRALGIGRDKIVLVSVARLTRRKGHHMMVAALARLPERLRRHIAWLVVGPDGEEDYVAELHDLVNTSDCEVHLLGRLPNEEIRDIYGASDLFCLTGVPDPSGRVEGFGLVYLEAAAGGLPSVATAIGGVPDAVIAGETGLLAAPDADAVAKAITTLAEDRHRRAAFAAAATSHARALTWERCAAETYGLPQRNAVTPSHADHAPRRAAAGH